jgi:hypothetical protein
MMMEPTRHGADVSHGVANIEPGVTPHYVTVGAGGCERRGERRWTERAAGLFLRCLEKARPSGTVPAAATPAPRRPLAANVKEH